MHCAAFFASSEAPLIVPIVNCVEYYLRLESFFLHVPTKKKRGKGFRLRGERYKVELEDVLYDQLWYYIRSVTDGKRKFNVPLNVGWKFLSRECEERG